MTNIRFLLARRACFLSGVALVAMSVPPGTSAAQDYPKQPIKLVLPFPPGGPTDLLTRVVSVKMGNALGQNFIIDNRAGASGMIGAEAVAHAAPDGYTILANASLHISPRSCSPRCATTRSRISSPSPSSPMCRLFWW